VCWDIVWRSLARGKETVFCVELREMKSTNGHVRSVTLSFLGRPVLTPDQSRPAGSSGRPPTVYCDLFGATVPRTFIFVTRFSPENELNGPLVRLISCKYNSYESTPRVKHRQDTKTLPTQLYVDFKDWSAMIWLNICNAACPTSSVPC